MQHEPKQKHCRNSPPILQINLVFFITPLLSECITPRTRAEIHQSRLKGIAVLPLLQDAILLPIGLVILQCVYRYKIEHLVFVTPVLVTAQSVARCVTVGEDRNVLVRCFAVVAAFANLGSTSYPALARTEVPGTRTLHQEQVTAIPDDVMGTAIRHCPCEGYQSRWSTVQSEYQWAAPVSVAVGSWGAMSSAIAEPHPPLTCTAATSAQERSEGYVESRFADVRVWSCRNPCLIQHDEVAEGPFPASSMVTWKSDDHWAMESPWENGGGSTRQPRIVWIC
jgi:hypothetical protein